MSFKDGFICKKSWEAEMLDVNPWFGNEPYVHSFPNERGDICDECKEVVKKLEKEKPK